MHPSKKVRLPQLPLPVRSGPPPLLLEASGEGVSPAIFIHVLWPIASRDRRDRRKVGGRGGPPTGVACPPPRESVTFSRSTSSPRCSAPEGASSTGSPMSAASGSAPSDERSVSTPTTWPPTSSPAPSKTTARSLDESGLAEATVAKVYGIFTRALRAGIADTPLIDPSRLIDPPKEPESQAVFLDHDQVETLCRLIDPHWRLLVEFHHRHDGAPGPLRDGEPQRCITARPAVRRPTRRSLLPQQLPQAPWAAVMTSEGWTGPSVTPHALRPTAISQWIATVGAVPMSGRRRFGAFTAAARRVERCAYSASAAG